MNLEQKIDWRGIIGLKPMIFRLVGITCAIIAFQGFLIPNKFLDGGITGIALLIHKIFHIHISPLLIVLNIPFLIMGYIKMGKNFAINSSFSILLLALGLFLIEIPAVTSDKFLIAMFGGMFIGLAIGFIIRSGGVIDGLEVIVEYTNSKSAFSSGEIIMTINTLIFLTAAYKFGLEKAMYSIITFYTALKTYHYVIDGFEAYTAMTIVSKEYDLIKKLLVMDFGKGISVYKGERGYLPDNFDVKHDCDILVAVVTRLEIFHMEKAILKVDPKAFIYIHAIKEVNGGLITRVKGH